MLHEKQKDVSARFGSKEPDKFAGVEWRSEVTGAPVIEGSIAWIDCDIHAIHDGGDHDIVVGLVRALDTAADTAPLIFFQGSYGRFEAL